MMDMKNINIEEIMSKAKEMQDQFQKMQQNFSQKELVALAGIKDDAKIFVEVVIDGARIVKKVTVGEGVLNEPKEILEELIETAVNNATQKLNEEMQTEVQKIYKTPDGT